MSQSQLDNIVDFINNPQAVDYDRIDALIDTLAILAKKKCHPLIEYDGSTTCALCHQYITSNSYYKAENCFHNIHIQCYEQLVQKEDFGCPQQQCFQTKVWSENFTNKIKNMIAKNTKQDIVIKAIECCQCTIIDNLTRFSCGDYYCDDCITDHFKHLHTQNLTDLKDIKCQNCAKTLELQEINIFDEHLIKNLKS